MVIAQAALDVGKAPLGKGTATAKIDVKQEIPSMLVDDTENPRAGET